MKRCDIVDVTPVLRAWIAAIAVVFCSAGTLLAADLTRQQANTLAQIDLNLKRAETGIPLVEQALGTGATPTASQLRLAESRLGQPQSLVSQLQPLMAKLPADHPDVAPVKKRLDAAAAKIAELEAKLGGGDEPAPANAGVKLDYRQEGQLKDAAFNLREVDGRADAVAEVIKQVEAAKDPGAIDYRMVDGAMNTIADARARGANGAGRLATLPADGQGVQSTSDALKKSLARLDGYEKTLKPLHTKLMSAVNPGSYPTLEADAKRLSELAQMYASPDVLENRRASAAELVGQLPAAATEKARIMKTYAAIIQQETDQGKKIGSIGVHFDKQYEAFGTAAQKQKASLPAQIKSDMADVTKLADQAAAEQKPAFFVGGIPQKMEGIEEKVALLSALDAAEGEAARKQVIALRADLKVRVDKLKQAIVDSNELPPDRYKGADRAQLEELAVGAWKKIQPDAKVLAIRIPSENWQREEIWRHQAGSWYKIDRSKVQVQLLVKKDDKVVVNRPIDLWKDHTQNEQINSFPMDTKESEIQPMNLILLSKVK